MAEVFLVDVGVLLDKRHPEYDAYSRVYDRSYGFFDEEQTYVRTSADAIKYATNYVKNGVDNTYAVVSRAELDDAVVEESYADEPFIDAEVCGEDYDVDGVVFSARKAGNIVVYDFIKRRG